MHAVKAVLIASLSVFNVFAHETGDCDEYNYFRYIYNDDKTEELIGRRSRGCILVGYDFDDVILNTGRSINLKKAYLDGADLGSKVITMANFEEARLYHADFGGSILDDVNFAMADMEGSNFRTSSLDRVSFNGANIQQTSFHGAYLREVSFVGVESLEGVNFYGADLRGADFTGVNLEGAFFRAAKYNGQTKGITEEFAKNASMV